MNNRRASTAYDRSIVTASVADTGRGRINPTELARKDSMVDSLKRLGRAFLNSPEGKAAVQGITGALAEASRQATKAMILVLVLFASPALILTVLTALWFTQRRADLRRAAA